MRLNGMFIGLSSTGIALCRPEMELQGRPQDLTIILPSRASAVSRQGPPHP